MSNQQNNRAPRVRKDHALESIRQLNPFDQKVTILNDVKLRLVGEPLEGNQAGRLPFLFFDIPGNYPRLTAQLNNGKKGDDGRIQFNLDMMAFQMIISSLEDAIRAKQPMSRSIAVKKSTFDRQANRPGEPYIFGYIIVGKDADGCEFIGIQRGNKDSRNYAKVKFGFTAPEYHPLIDTATGQPASRQEVSSLIARGYVRFLTHAMTFINTALWEYASTAEGKRTNKQNSGGNQQKGYGDGYGQRKQAAENNGYGGGGNSSTQTYSEPTEGFDDDLPF